MINISIYGGRAILYLSNSLLSCWFSHYAEKKKRIAQNLEQFMSFQIPQK